ncbi:MAG: peptidylprolyl isomerase, partial [Gemmatimonadaceae bacterium]
MTYQTHALRVAAAFLLAGTALACAAQPRASQLEQLRLAEDGRGADPQSLAPIFAALRPESEAVVLRAAIRAVGRLQRPAFVDSVAPFLTYVGRGMRIEAANAVAQSVQPGTDTVAVDKARGLLLQRLRATADDELGVVARSLGRIPHQSPAIGQQMAERIAETVSPHNGATRVCPRDVRRGASLDTMHAGHMFGALHGIYAVARRSRGLGCEAATLARGALGYRMAATGDTAAWVRELAMLALQAGNHADSAVVHGAARDPDPRVRRLALRVTRETPSAVAVRAATTGLSDSAARVRIDAVRALLVVRSPEGCALAQRAMRDASAHVRAEAVDALASACEAPVSTPVLDSLVRLLPGDTVSATGSWHTAARALVALARTAPNSATPHFAHFRVHPVWQVRAALAAAARATGDSAVLLDLLQDRDANVREETITLLAQLAPALRERAARAGLAANEYQVVLAGAQAAKDVPGIELATLLAALERLTARREETSRDPRNELMDRIAENQIRATEQQLQPYFSDFDPLIARRAGELAERWGLGQRLLRRPLTPRQEALGDERDLELRITLSPASGGSTFRVRLFNGEAPSTVARITRLARAGYYNGRTFHRVVPNFVIQGGSPDANEYVGDGPFMRDELGLRAHSRGTLGISTRGRDTGDAQIFVNLVDNFRLDHDYTVFGEVVEGMDVVD